MFEKDFHKFVESLEKSEVKYLIVGGYAVGIHGHPRFTGDMDIWIEVSDENAERVVSAVQLFGFASLGLKKEDFLLEGNLIQIGQPLLRIDLLTQIDGVAFDDCYSRRKTLNVAGLKFELIGYQDLLKIKESSNRPKDRQDVESLKSQGIRNQE
jgi:hypothetical protein